MFVCLLLLGHVLHIRQQVKGSCLSEMFFMVISELPFLTDL